MRNTQLAIAVLLICTPLLAQPVNFSDENLRGVVEGALGKANPTKSDLLELKILDGSSQEIRNLKGLEEAKNLHTLYMWNNQISDLSPLSDLPKLRVLLLGKYEVGGNTISDLGPLRSLTQLLALNILYNQVHDLNPLSTLVNLNHLEIGNNPITDISPIANLVQIESLWSSRNPGVDYSCLSSLVNLKQLGLSQDDIKDISFLQDMRALTRLFLGNNQIEDIAVLSLLSNLEDLSLNHNQISDLSPLLSHSRLEGFNVSSNPLSDRSCRLYIPMIQANNPLTDSFKHSCTNGSSKLLYVDVEGPFIGSRGPSEDGSSEFPYSTIQKAIDHNEDFDRIIVLPGVYTGQGNMDLDLQGKSFLLESLAGPKVTTIESNGNKPAFHLNQGEQISTIIKGFAIKGSPAVVCENSSVTLANCHVISQGHTALKFTDEVFIVGTCKFVSAHLEGTGMIHIEAGSELRTSDCNINSIVTGAGILTIQPRNRLLFVDQTQMN